MPSDFMIGLTNDIYSFLPLDQILDFGDSADPDWSFQPFSTSVRLADGTLQGNGFPIAKWRWKVMTDANRQILKSFVGSNLSAEVYIRTATNDVDLYDAIEFKTFLCVMNWSDQDEDFQADKVLDLIITFTHLVEVVE